MSQPGGTLVVLRTAGKRLLSVNTRDMLRAQVLQLREHGLAWTARWNALFIDAAVRERLHRHRYQVLSEADLIGSRRSDTVFVFGSGYSLNDITPGEWDRIAAYDTFGFTGFIAQRWVRTDYHLIRGGVEVSLTWRPFAEDFCRTLNENPHFTRTILILQGEYRAVFANQILGYGLVRPGTRIFRYRTARGEGLPSLAFAGGIRHGAGTLCDAVNAAVCMGWRRIVLTGVDLYDSRYFWLKPDETLQFDEATGLTRPGQINARGGSPNHPHNTTRNGIVEALGDWRTYLERERGCSLEVYNPRSLLAPVMPVFQWSREDSELSHAR